jgi:hypothetical protein
LTLERVRISMVSNEERVGEQHHLRERVMVEGRESVMGKTVNCERWGRCISRDSFLGNDRGGTKEEDIQDVKVCGRGCGRADEVRVALSHARTRAKEMIGRVRM